MRKERYLQTQLNLQLGMNGLHGRFLISDPTQGAKEPKLLPKMEYFTKLVVKY